MFKPGESGNPSGGHPRSISKLKWDLIDSYIADATKWAFEVVDGTADGMASLKDREKLDIKMKAYSNLVKLAPNRQQHSGLDGGPIETKSSDPVSEALAKEYEDKLRVQVLKKSVTSIPTETITNITSLPS